MRFSAFWEHELPENADVVGETVVAAMHVPPDVLRNHGGDVAHRAVAHGYVNISTFMLAARLSLLERACLPGAHAAEKIIDCPFTIVAVADRVIGLAAVPTRVAAGDA